MIISKKYSRMPRVKQKASRSFKELCLQSISSNIDRFWCREFLENYHGKAHYLFVLGGWVDWKLTDCGPFYKNVIPQNKTGKPNPPKHYL